MKVIKITNNRYGTRSTIIVRADMVIAVSVVIAPATKRKHAMEPADDAQARVVVAITSGASFDCDAEPVEDAESRAAKLRSALGWSDEVIEI